MKQIFLCLTLVFLAAIVRAETFTIRDIRLEGLQRVSASPVFAAMPVRVGDTVDSVDLRETMQSIFDTGFFTNIQIARDGDVLILVLQERPAIKEINIDGNKVIKTEQLIEIMNDNGLSEGEILEGHLLSGITRELERQYVSQARYGAKVKTEVEDIPNNMVKINIDIDEGGSASIRHLNIVGNTDFSDEELKELFESRPKKWNDFFSSKHKYAQEKLKGDIEKLESFYLNKGYLDFSVVSTQISISPDKKSVFITLNLNEGDIYSVKKIDIAGDPILSEKSIRRIILFREGDTFSQGKMTATSEYITNLLGNAGYTNAKVEGVPQKNEGENTINLNFFINPGKRVYVRRIEFKGNTKTDDVVLRREMRLFEGASASNSRIEQSKVRLERLGYFKEVNVETKDVSGTDDLVDVEYSVEEQPSGSISATVGYAQFSGLNLGVSVEQNNWMGTGKRVSFGVNTNIYQDSYTFRYLDPYFTPDGVSRGFNVFFRATDFSRVGVSEYSTDSYGASVDFGYPISEVSRVNFSLGVINQKVTTGAFAPQEIIQSPARFNDVADVFVNISEYSDFLSGEIDSLTLSPLTDNSIFTSFNDDNPGFVDKFGSEFNSLTFAASWNRFALNRGVLATRGTSQTLAIEGTVPGSELEYFKITYDAEAFVPLNKTFTMRFRTSLGYGDGYGKMDELPFFENFRSGGFGSVRGFESSTLGPRASPSFLYSTAIVTTDQDNDGIADTGETAYLLCDELDSSFCDEVGRLAFSELTTFDVNGDAFGGNVLVEFGAELILPIPFLKDTRSMQLALFVDAGNVFSSNCRETQLNCSEVDLNNLSSSAGLGFTWLSGFGPMTFSLSKALHENEFDEREAFQFTFGTGF